MKRTIEERNLDRCDRCKKWVGIHDIGSLGSLEGIVSPGTDINFSICSKCFEQKGFDSTFWDKWAVKRSKYL